MICAQMLVTFPQQLLEPMTTPIGTELGIYAVATQADHLHTQVCDFPTAVLRSNDNTKRQRVLYQQDRLLRFCIHAVAGQTDDLQTKDVSAIQSS